MARVCADGRQRRVGHSPARAKFGAGSAHGGQSKAHKRRHDGRHGGGGRAAKSGRGQWRRAAFHWYPGGSERDPLNLCNVTGRTPTHDDGGCSPADRPTVDPNAPIELPRHTSLHDPLGLEKPDSEVGLSSKVRKRRRRHKAARKRRAKALAKQHQQQPAGVASADGKSRRRRSTVSKSSDAHGSHSTHVPSTSKADGAAAAAAAGSVSTHGRLNAKRKDRFRYGNHPAGSIAAAGDDHRLAILAQLPIAGRAVLDIGCNVGGLTVAVAERCRPDRIVAIDIDAALVGRARRALKLHIQNVEKEAATDSARLRSLYAVEFRTENYVLETDEQLNQVAPSTFDLIVALSVTKWMHLNWGDAGVKMLFRRAFAQLRPGGCLLLEPHHFASYARHRSVAAQVAKNCAGIEFTPDQFTDYLLTQVGFKSCEVLGDCDGRTSADAKRPMLLFKKAGGD